MCTSESSISFEQKFYVGKWLRTHFRSFDFPYDLAHICCDWAMIVVHHKSSLMNQEYMSASISHSMSFWRIKLLKLQIFLFGWYNTFYMYSTLNFVLLRLRTGESASYAIEFSLYRVYWSVWNICIYVNIHVFVWV